MRCKINVRAVVALKLSALIGIAVLIALNLNPIDILAAIALLGCLVLIGFLIDKAGLGKYFGGKT